LFGDCPAPIRADWSGLSELQLSKWEKWEEQSAPAVEQPIWTKQWLPSDQQSMETILSTRENASRAEWFVLQSIDLRAGATIQMRREYVPSDGFGVDRSGSGRCSLCHHRVSRRGRWWFGGGGGYSASFGSNYAEGGGDCHLVVHRIMTRHGWRTRRVQVCS
jgi:hypothetical protein